MLNDLERMTLVVLTGVVLVGGLTKISIDDQIAKKNAEKIEEEKKQEFVRQQEKMQEQWSTNSMSSTPPYQLPQPSSNLPDCNNNSFAPGCRNNVVPIDPSPAERAMQNPNPGERAMQNVRFR